MSIPQFMIDALLYNDYPDHEDNVIGVTTLIDSARIRKLLRNFYVEPDPMSRISLFIGSAVHKYIESSISYGISERRFDYAVGDIVVSGQIDFMHDGIIYDIKTTKASSVAYGIKDSWFKQLNVYRWLCEKNGRSVDGMRIVRVFKDWSEGDKKRMSRYDYSYPPEPVDCIVVPFMDNVEQYVLRRIEIHQSDELPECDFEERWARPKKFAVHKGRKYKAERVFDTLKEALEYSALNGEREPNIHQERVSSEYGYYIYERPERWVRCEGYCPVSEHCSQWQEFRQATQGSA